MIQQFQITKHAAERIELRLKTRKFEKLAKKAWVSSEQVSYANKLQYQTEFDTRKDTIFIKAFLGYIWIFEKTSSLHGMEIIKLITVHGCDKFHKK